MSTIPDRFLTRPDAKEATNPPMVKWDTKGQTVVGYLRGSKVVNGANGQFRVLTVMTEQGIVAVVAGAILTDLLSEVPADSEVCIEYIGMAGDAKDFKVRYIPPAPRGSAR